LKQERELREAAERAHIRTGLLRTPARQNKHKPGNLFDNRQSGPKHASTRPTAYAHGQPQQSTITRMVNKLNNLYTNPTEQLMQQLGVKAQVAMTTKPPERLQLKLAEEQHIKAILDQSVMNALMLNIQATLIAALNQNKN
jgi:hypothetical protein